MTSPENIVVTVSRTAPPGGPGTEMCEHKGVGHPDTVCDGGVEAAARALSQAYLADYGIVQHFNLDKALLVGGTSEPRFGGGHVTRRMRLLISGPVTRLGSEAPEGVVRRAVTDYLAKTLGLDASLIKVEPMLRTGAPNLRSVNAHAGMPCANDTSFGVGYAPLSRLERAVLEAAEMLGSRELRDAFPVLGLDYKIMGYRIGERMQLTIAVAFVDRYVGSVGEYFEQKSRIAARIADALDGACAVQCNTHDDMGAQNESGLYLTVTGLSAEHGDDGEVGRGNRANRLITPCRPMSLEAVAGKNPASHVGKLYNVLAHQLAQRILDDTVGVKHVTVGLLSAIGAPIDQPQLATVDVCAPEGLSEIQCRLIQERVLEGLNQLPALTRDLIEGKVQIC